MCFILTLSLILLSVNTFLLEENKNGNIMTAHDCIQWRGENLTSAPTCSYVDRYPLGDEVYVRICHSEGNITLDIRRFKQDEGTTNGIQINKMQWQYLKNSIDHIDSSLMDISL